MLISVDNLPIDPRAKMTRVIPTIGKVFEIQYDSIFLIWNWILVWVYFMKY